MALDYHLKSETKEKREEVKTFAHRPLITESKRAVDSTDVEVVDSVVTGEEVVEVPAALQNALAPAAPAAEENVDEKSAGVEDLMLAEKDDAMEEREMEGDATDGNEREEMLPESVALALVLKDAVHDVGTRILAAVLNILCIGCAASMKGGFKASSHRTVPTFSASSCSNLGFTPAASASRPAFTSSSHGASTPFGVGNASFSTSNPFAAFTSQASNPSTISSLITLTTKSLTFECNDLLGSALRGRCANVFTAWTVEDDR
ncbi:hypothetical protein HDU97_005315, partial [Phlyctochytrium planicorne]